VSSGAPRRAPSRGIRPPLVAALAVGLLVSGCAHSGAALTPRGLQPAASTAKELSKALEPRRLAVVVGVGSYDDPAFQDLEYPPADATALAEVLAADSAGGFDRVVVLADGPSTRREEILRQLREVTGDLGREDVLVVYFSGHGTAAQGPDQPARLYLLPSDAVPAELDSTALDLTDLRDFFGRLEPMRKALIIDACFNGQGKSAIDPDLRPRIDELLQTARGTDLSQLGSGEAHLYATTVGRPAFEDPNVGHGIYTHYLLQALSWARAEADLDDDGVITSYEAHDYARGRTMEHTGGVQVPEASMRLVGLNDVVLVGESAARGERDRALVFDYRGEHGPYAGTTLYVDGRAKGVFPGAVLVPPGTRHIELRDGVGEVVLDGYVKLESRQSVALRELPVMVREDRVLSAVRLGGLFGPSASWGATWGRGNVAVELFGALRRARKPARGLMAGASFGLAVSPTREGATGLVTRGRGTFWLALEMGWAGELRRARLRLAWQARATAVPVARLPGAAHATLPEESGWLIFSMGPVVHLGVALDRRMTLVVVTSLQTSPFRASPEAPVRLHPFVGVTGGLEWAL